MVKWLLFSQGLQRSLLTFEVIAEPENEYERSGKIERQLFSTLLKIILTIFTYSHFFNYYNLFRYFKFSLFFIYSQLNFILLFIIFYYFLNKNTASTISKNNLKFL